MFKFTTTLKAMGAAAVFGLSSLFAAPVEAQQVSLRDILRAVEQNSAEISRENQERLDRFRSDASQQQAELQRLRNEVASLRAQTNQFDAEFATARAEYRELEAQRSQLAGEFQELTGQFRTAVSEVTPELSRSLANFDPSVAALDIPGREAPMNRIAALFEVSQAESLPTREQLDRLPNAILKEMVAQAEAKTFQASVANSGKGGTATQQEVFRVGVATAAITDGTRFVQVGESAGGQTFLQEFSEQPSGKPSKAMSDAINAGDGELVKAPFDPSGGKLFDLLKDVPSWSSRLLNDGGIIGRIIIGFAIIGVLLGLYKIVSLFLLSNSMRSTAKNKRAGTGNPLARVFEVYEQNKAESVETLELKLDEQILKETPRIERFNDIIKVMAAVAPLLGLLGTVIGMIITFTQITLFGAGDPRIMAGGISVALITTVLGLIAAIPLILLHALAAGSARSAQQVLDEQAAGLVAERAEGQGRSATLTS